MRIPPTDPRHRPIPTEPSRSDVAAALLAALLVPAAIWALTNPLVGLALLASIPLLRLVARRLVGWSRELAERRTVRIRLGRLVRITITDPERDACRPPEACC